MSKSRGKKLGLKFTHNLIGDNLNNESAFTVKGQEYQYVNGPDNNGPLLSVNYDVESVENYPGSEDTLLLTAKDSNRFNNVLGDITVMYDESIGNLVGRGGPVASFEHSFTPEDLEPLPNPGHSERVGAKVGQVDIELKEIQYLDVVSESHVVGTSVGETTISLKDVNDINP